MPRKRNRNDDLNALLPLKPQDCHILLVLLDVDMPKLDGFSTCERIRAMPGFETIPILMVTGLDDTESIDRAYSAGATDFATKPINWSLLPHRLRHPFGLGFRRGVALRSRKNQNRG